MKKIAEGGVTFSVTEDNFVKIAIDEPSAKLPIEGIMMDAHQALEFAYMLGRTAQEAIRREDSGMEDGSIKAH